ncbi:FAD dependent oxidoreductase [Xylaria digitata]|nr:FAD dependent oxidoreductase [Xylaria digitata]
MFSSNDVAIIGGGLSGLATALALHKLSIKCSVYEMRETNAAPPTSSGALMLSPNAPRILDRFGTIDRYPFGGMSAFGYQALRIYRQDLLDILYTACSERNIPIHFGKRFAEVIDESDNHVVFKFTDGTTNTASLLIGSDGIHSKVRDHVIPDIEKTFIGLGGLTWEIPTKQLRIPEGKDYKFPVTILTANGALFFADKEGPIELVTKNIEVWPDVAKSGMENIDHETMNVWPFYMIPRLPDWTSQKHHRVVILGDAAHAMPPTTGQGASQAFEDVMSLALVLSALKENAGLKWDDALQFWQKMRQDRIDDLLVLTKQLNNKRLPLEKQNLLAKDDLWADESATNPSQMAWLYTPKIDEAVNAWVRETATNAA